MKKIFTRRVFAIVCLLAAMGIITSCEKEDTSKTSAIELLSFGPAGVKHGEDISLIGNNLDKVTAVEFTGATVSKEQFKQQSSELIVLTVPTEAVRGKVTLKTEQGDIVSKAVIDFEVPVLITSVTASARPGTNISIKGSHVNWISSVTFAKDVVVQAKDFVSSTLSEIVVTVPMNAQTGPLILSTGGTEPLSLETTVALNVVLPVITSFSPSPVERNANLTITGTNLDLATAVLFQGADSVKTFVSKTATQIVVKVPAKAAKGKIAVVAPSGIMIESAEALKLVGDLPPLDPFPYALYTDGLENGYQDWSWAGKDFANTGIVRQGSKSIKVTYGSGGYEGITFHNDNGVNATVYTKLEFSIYGGDGTDGKKLNIVTNGNWGSPYKVDIKGGEWKDISIPVSELNQPAAFKEIIFQSDGFSGVIYIDHVGFR